MSNENPPDRTAQRLWVKLSAAEKQRNIAEQERDAAQRELMSCAQAFNRLTVLLHEVSSVLKGEPQALVLDDWSDLPELARECAAAAKWQPRVTNTSS